MKDNKQTQLFKSMKSAQKRLLKLSPKDRTKLEQGWDVEHAYYSSVLEGSDIDKKEFDKLALEV